MIVREDDIVFRGKQYKSLLEVAYRITDTKRSGLRFFGLKANRQEQNDGALQRQSPTLRSLYTQEL